MGISFRHAQPENLDQILPIYAEARAFMRSSGNLNQWVNGYPHKEMLLEDIARKQLYLCEENGEILAVFCYFQGIDPTYVQIFDGQWLNDRPYGVIHRIAVRQQGKGIAKLCYDWALERCGDLRIDTHRDNKPMQRSLARYGFTQCGIIYLANGDERIAFHKTVM